MGSIVRGVMISALGIACVSGMASGSSQGPRGAGANCGASLRSAVEIEAAREVAVTGSTAFVLTGTSGLLSFDVSDLSNPMALDTVSLGPFTNQLIVDGDTAYCLSLDTHLFTVDISDPENMVLLSDFEISKPGFLLATGLAIQDGVVYIMASNKMFIIDVSDPSNPVLVDELVALTTDVAVWEQIQIQGSYAFINGAYDIGHTGEFAGGIGIWDIANPMDITLVGYVATHVESFAVQGSNLYIDSPGLVIADISDPSDPVIVSEQTAAGPDMGVSVDGNFAVYEDDYFNVADPENPYRLYHFSAFSRYIQMSLLEDNVVYAITNAGLEILNIDDCGMVCDADLTGDGRVDFFDVSLFLQLFLAQDPGADLNGDSSFDFNDVSVFLDLYAIGCP